MLLFALGVGKAQVNKLDLIVFDLLQNLSRHLLSLFLTTKCAVRPYRFEVRGSPAPLCVGPVLPDAADWEAIGRMFPEQFWIRNSDYLRRKYGRPLAGAPARFRYS